MFLANFMFQTYVEFESRIQIYFQRLVKVCISTFLEIPMLIFISFGPEVDSSSKPQGRRQGARFPQVHVVLLSFN